jgi:hypothetical protein
MDISTIQPVFIAAFGSAVVSYYWYINNQIDPTKPSEKFNFGKVAPAVLTGAIIGALSVIIGFEPLTDANVGVQMVAFGLLTSVIETGMKTFSRWFNSGFEVTENESN